MTKPNIADAIALAAKVHRDQRDKAGQPYILHPLRVMQKQSDEPAQIVAVLHDVLEDSSSTDSPVTASDLRAASYSDDVVAAIEALTKREGESYEDFIERAGTNPLARRVKLADLEDNMNLMRMTELNTSDAERLRKYHAAWRRLSRES